MLIYRDEHWTPKRKEELLLAIAAGSVTEAAALAEHGLTPEELDEWRRRYSREGRRGLRVTKR
jgi:transposase-like protein